jgi:two-component system sensor histidine kinase DegS
MGTALDDRRTRTLRDSTPQSAEPEHCVAARLNERATIAMDLHDNTIQALHGAVLSLAAAERSPEIDLEQMRSAVHEVRDQLNSTIHDLRQYLCRLRPCGPAASGLSAGLVRLAERIRLNPAVRAHVDIDESVQPLVREGITAEHLLAIASEACSNAIRHGHARSVAIRLYQERGRAVLTVADDGRGFDTRTRVGVAGHGLENMYQRAALLGAGLRITSCATGGTQLRVELQLRTDNC